MISKNLYILGSIVAAVVIAGAGIIFFREAKESVAPGNNSSGLIVAKSAIYVSEQKSGNTISVSIARLEKPGFAVVHEDINDKAGAILGASVLLPVGETENLSPISLSRTTTDGETVYAMLHFDDGDGKFNATKDLPAIDSVSGEPITMVVQISEDALEPGAVNP